MNSRFVLPAMVSTALYALVFSLGNGTHAPRPPVAPQPSAAQPRPTLVTIVEHEEEVIPDVSTAPTKRGSVDKDEYRPPSDDPPQPEGIFNQQPVTRVAVPNDHPQITSTIPKIWDGSNSQGDSPGIFSPGMLDNQPRERARVAPVYPNEAHRQGITGEVLVEFIVDTTGRVTHAQIIRSSNWIFDDATLRAVERWRFEPGKRHGRAVPFRMSVPVVFGLDNS